MLKPVPFLFCSLILLRSALAGTDAAAPEKQTESNALSFPVSYTGEVLGNLSGGYRQGAVYDGVLNIGVQGDLEKLAGWPGASFLVSGLYPHGASLTDRYVHDFNVVSNIDAPDSARLYEAWLQEEAGAFSIRLGQLAADCEFFIAPTAGLFINSAFGAIPLVSQNCLAPVYPVAVPGGRVLWKATEALSVQAGIYHGGAAENGSENPHGLDWNATGGVLALTELIYNRDPGKSGLGGVYKLGGFYHSPSECEAFPENGSEARAGGYAIADQALWREPGTEDQGLSAFVRIGGAPSDRSEVPFYFDTGFNYKGLIPGRDADIAGLGLSYTKLSSALRDEDGNGLGRHHETILEATYKAQVNQWLALQPDVQYIFNPGACEKADNALVAGLRFSVTF